MSFTSAGDLANVRAVEKVEIRVHQNIG